MTTKSTAKPAKPPTLGALVWFYPGPQDHLYSDEDPLVALVCGVKEDKVNLAVFDRLGEGATSRQDISFVEKPDEELLPYASWPEEAKSEIRHEAKHEAKEELKVEAKSHKH
jgi:hypothetical protein